MSGLQAIKYSRGKLEVLDQLRLPHSYHYDEVSTSEEAFDCIKSMRVRGNYFSRPSASQSNCEFVHSRLTIHFLFFFYRRTGDRYCGGVGARGGIV